MQLFLRNFIVNFVSEKEALSLLIQPINLNVNCQSTKLG